MFLLLVIALQLGAATAPDDDFRDELRRSVADTGGHRQTVRQNVIDRFKYFADPNIVLKEYGKLPDDMAIGDWIRFYRKHQCRPTVYQRFSLYVEGNRSSELVRRYKDASHDLICKRDEAQKKNRIFQELQTERYKAVVKQAEAAVLVCTEEAYQAEKAILCKILRNDPDYFPGRATAEAQEFMQSWEDPGFRCCSEQTFFPFLQGLFSKLDPSCRKQALDFGNSVAGGFGKFLLELKYNAPVVAIAIVQAILDKEAQAGKDIISQEYLSIVYAYFATHGECRWIYCTEIRGAQKLGQSYAERVKSFVTKAITAC